MYDINFSLNALHAEQKFQQTTFWNIFLMFPRKQALAFHANWLLRSQFAWNSKAYFLENVIKMLIINLLSAELAQREVMVNGHEKATDQGEKPLRLGLNFINKNTLRENIMEKCVNLSLFCRTSLVLEFIPSSRIPSLKQDGHMGPETLSSVKSTSQPLFNTNCWDPKKNSNS